MPDLKNTLTAALSEPRPTLVEFYADWCPHCRRMKPIVDELRQIVSHKVSIIQIEGDGNPGLMMNIVSIRTRHGCSSKMARKYGVTAVKNRSVTCGI